jgi:hypothetical protein
VGTLVVNTNTHQPQPWEEAAGRMTRRGEWSGAGQESGPTTGDHQGPPFPTPPPSPLRMLLGFASVDAYWTLVVNTVQIRRKVCG